MSTSSVPEGARFIGADSIEPIDESSNFALVYPIAKLYEGTSSMSVTKVSITGRHRTLSSRRSTRLYLTLRGVLTFVLDGGEPIVVSSGDSLVIPRGCVYSLEGNATYLVLNTPAFEDGDDIYAE